ncbi:MAG: phosphoribosyltransferase [Thiobacillus sp.]|nr:phosphoribosyltransferase [Verrucomicrobiae bacterium]MCP5277640.1 phosphoribosyltransferase [Thiobacillus sp.]
MSAQPSSTPIPCELVTWNRFHAQARQLARKVRDSGFRPDILVAIGRGGYMPARVLSDFLDLPDLNTFKVEHYQSTRISRQAVVRYPLSGSLKGRNVLLVDDVSDSGDTFAAAIRHLKGKGTPAELRTAVLHHKVVSSYTPDYYVQRIVKWRWIIYPWAMAEDLSSLIGAFAKPPWAEDVILERLAADHGIRVTRPLLRDVLAMMDG